MKNRPSRKKLIFSVTLFFSGRIWMSVYECLCIYVRVCVCVCIHANSLILLSLISSWESYRSDFMSSSQLLCIVFPANCYVSLPFSMSWQSFLTYLMTVFQGRYFFFFFFSFGGEERGSHLVRIIAKNWQVKTKLSWDVQHISLLTCPSNPLCL